MCYDISDPTDWPKWRHRWRHAGAASPAIKSNELILVKADVSVVKTLYNIHEEYRHAEFCETAETSAGWHRRGVIEISACDYCQRSCHHTSRRLAWYRSSVHRGDGVVTSVAAQSCRISTHHRITFDARRNASALLYNPRNETLEQMASLDATGSSSTLWAVRLPAHMLYFLQQTSAETETYSYARLVTRLHRDYGRKSEYRSYHNVATHNDGNLPSCGNWSTTNLRRYWRGLSDDRGDGCQLSSQTDQQASTLNNCIDVVLKHALVRPPTSNVCTEAEHHGIQTFPYTPLDFSLQLLDTYKALPHMRL